MSRVLTIVLEFPLDGQKDFAVGDEVFGGRIIGLELGNSISRADMLHDDLLRDVPDTEWPDYSDFDEE